MTGVARTRCDTSMSVGINLRFIKNFDVHIKIDIVITQNPSSLCWIAAVQAFAGALGL